MKSLSVVLLQKDPGVARFLSGQLCHHFHAVHVVRSSAELREAVPRFRPDVVVVDMESAPLSEVEQLHREYANLCIVCTHRIADEEMWTAALDAGAADICSATDTHGILTAALRNGQLARSAAA
jgi:AmiR/NasT family two-component response regulator